MICRGGIILEKLKNPNFPKWPRAGSGIRLRHLLQHLLRNIMNFFFQIWIVFNGPAERSEATQRVSQPTGAKQPATS